MIYKGDDHDMVTAKIPWAVDPLRILFNPLILASSGGFSNKWVI